MLDKYYKEPDAYISLQHNRNTPSVNHNFHLHNNYEIYYLVSGDVEYFIEKKKYILSSGDILVINNNEIHRATFLSRALYERFVINVDPNFIKIFNLNGFSLLSCFENRQNGEQNRIHLSSQQAEDVEKIYMKLININHNKSEEASLLKLTCILELLVALNKAFSGTNADADYPNIPKALVPILDFIDKNLDAPLTLDVLSERFFLNGTYLSRLFKKATGSNLHSYILYKRISKAKKLLASGCNVTEACLKSGFGDHSNFCRMFKRTVGVTPGHYGRQMQESFR